MLNLYYAPHTCALASHIVLEEIGVDYVTTRVSFADNQQQSPDFLKVNPKARVPALATDRGILTETPAMLVYIASLAPDACLVPMGDPFAFAEIQSFNSYLCSTVHVAHAHRMRGNRWADEPASFADMQRKVPQSVGACYATIEQHLLTGPWVMGQHYSVCDPYLFTIAQWMENDGVDPARFPRVFAHRERVAARPAVRRAIAAELA